MEALDVWPGEGLSILALRSGQGPSQMQLREFTVLLYDQIHSGQMVRLEGARLQS